MGAHGIALGQEGHIINILPPTAAIAGSPYSDWFHLKEAAHATIVITTGAMTSATTFTLYESTSTAGSSATVLGATAGLNYKTALTTLSDIYTAPASFTTSGLTSGLTVGQRSFVIEVDSQDLTDGYPYLAVRFTSTATLSIQAIAILTGLRYASDINESAID